jgi:creatinine amidohydrolase/Fe(II)-dependent formamide hydrolase-like protein
VRVLTADSFRGIVLVNGHGATNHMKTLERIAREETRPGELTVLRHHGLGPACAAARGSRPRRTRETAIMLAVASEHVRLDELPPAEVPLRCADHGIVEASAFDGMPTDDFTVPPDADPRAATREEGEEIQREVRAAVAHIEEELERW